MEGSRYPHCANSTALPLQPPAPQGFLLLSARCSVLRLVSASRPRCRPAGGSRRRQRPLPARPPEGAPGRRSSRRLERGLRVRGSSPRGGSADTEQRRERAGPAPLPAARWVSPGKRLGRARGQRRCPPGCSAHRRVCTEPAGNCLNAPRHS